MVRWPCGTLLLRVCVGGGDGRRAVQATLSTVTAERDRLDAELGQANAEFTAQAKEQSEALGAREAAQTELAAAREELSEAQARVEAAAADARVARERQEFLESQIEALQVRMQHALA